MDKRTRCFGNKDPLMAEYHDTEWGVPLHDDNAHVGKEPDIGVPVDEFIKKLDDRQQVPDQHKTQEQSRIESCKI